MAHQRPRLTHCTDISESQGSARTVWLSAPCAILLLSLSACPTMPPDQAKPNVLPPEQLRVAFQSQCAQNVIECTGSWPTAVVTIDPLASQTITETATGFILTDPNGGDSVTVQLIGSDSLAGEGAVALTHSWSSSAVIDDPCSLPPGTEFSSEENPTIEMAPGFHYIRLTVSNDIIRDQVPLEGCDNVLMNVASFDFLEIELEIRN